MTENVNPVIESSGAASSAASSTSTDGAYDGARVGRVLDAAADLLLRWGYRRVTMDDVAARAGIGKGTVYLHFRTKEALFLTVLLRGYRGLMAGIAGRMRADPEEAMPARMMRSLYLALRADPLARAMYMGDTELLGRLAQEAGATLGELRGRGVEVARAHFARLNEAGLLRADLEVADQMYVLDAVGSGFYFVEPLGLPFAPDDPEVRARLLEHTVAAAIQSPGATPTAALADAVAADYESLLEHIDAEWTRRVR